MNEKATERTSSNKGQIEYYSLEQLEKYQDQNGASQINSERRGATLKISRVVLG